MNTQHTLWGRQTWLHASDTRLLYKLFLFSQESKTHACVCRLKNRKQHKAICASAPLINALKRKHYYLSHLCLNGLYLKEIMQNRMTYKNRKRQVGQ